MAGGLVRGPSQHHSGRGTYERMAAAERILDGRNRGRQMHELATAEGITVRTAYRYLDAALARRETPKVEEFRKQQNDSLDLTERQNEEQMEAAEYIAKEAAKTSNFDLILKAAAMRQQAIKTRLYIAERRAKLNGLDAPVQVQATVTHLSEVDAELAAMVREAERAAEETRPAT